MIFNRFSVLYSDSDSDSDLNKDIKEIKNNKEKKVVKKGSKVKEKLFVCKEVNLTIESMALNSIEISKNIPIIGKGKEIIFNMMKHHYDTMEINKFSIRKVERFINFVDFSLMKQIFYYKQYNRIVSIVKFNDLFIVSCEDYGTCFACDSLMRIKDDLESSFDEIDKLNLELNSSNLEMGKQTIKNRITSILKNNKDLIKEHIIKIFLKLTFYISYDEAKNYITRRIDDEVIFPDL